MVRFTNSSKAGNFKSTKALKTKSSKLKDPKLIQFFNKEIEKYYRSNGILQQTTTRHKLLQISSRLQRTYSDHMDTSRFNPILLHLQWHSSAFVKQYRPLCVRQGKDHYALRLGLWCALVLRAPYHNTIRKDNLSFLWHLSVDTSIQHTQLMNVLTDSLRYTHCPHIKWNVLRWMVKPTFLRTRRQHSAQQCQRERRSQHGQLLMWFLLMEERSGTLIQHARAA